MQNYYNQISEQKRIAFIDNLTDDQARELSSKYPFAMCFASNTSTEKPYPVIWYNQKRYGFTNVNKGSIQIYDVSINLAVTDGGELKLQLSGNIDSYDLSSVINKYTNEFSNELTSNIDNNGIKIYSIETIKNQAILNFKFFSNDIDVTNDTNYEIEFTPYENDYYKISKISNSQYLLKVKKTSTSTQTIKSNISINGNITFNHQFKCNLKYIPTECIWYFNEEQVSGNLINIYRTQNSPIRFSFKNGDLDSNKFKLKLHCHFYTSGGTYDCIPFDNIENNYNRNFNESNTILGQFQTHTNYTSAKLVVEITEKSSEINNNIASNSSELTRRLESTVLTINIKNDSSDLIYIGLPTSSEVNNILNGITNIYEGASSTTTIENFNSYNDIYGWHKFEEYNFNEKFINKNINLNKQIIIILPENYKLALPIYQNNNGQLSNPIDDPMWIIDNTRGNNGTIQINDKNYTVYKYNGQYDDLSKPNLLSMIVPV